MISGRSRLTTYENTENLKPGTISSVTAAPPTRGRRSSTTTRLPARARYAAATRPLWPPPTTMASYELGFDTGDEATVRRASKGVGMPDGGVPVVDDTGGLTWTLEPSHF